MDDRSTSIITRISANGTGEVDPHDHALRALKAWFRRCPDDSQIVVSRLSESGGFPSRGFPIDRLEEIAELYAGETDVFVRLSVLHVDEILQSHQRGRRNQTYGTALLHLDLDPDGEPAFQERTIEALRAFQFPPSMIDISGRGIHAEWLLDKFTTEIDRVEQINRWIRDQFHGKADKSTWGVARVFRLPGTINPRSGSVGMARIVELHEDRTYSLKQFEEAMRETESEFPRGGGDAQDDEPYTSVLSDDEIEEKILGSASRAKYLRLKSGDMHGYEKEDGSGYDGSAADAALVMMLARHTYDPQQIDRLFRRSHLVDKDRWEIDTYREVTIASAIEKVKEARTIGVEKLTDLKLSSIFAERHGEDLRYDGDAKEWLEWDGTRFKRDVREQYQERAKETVTYLLREALRLPHSAERDNAVKWAQAAQSKRAIDAMTQLARSDERIAVTSEDLDLDPYILNTLTHTLEFRREGLVVREHRRSDMLTKVAPVEFDPRAECPTFDRFLAEATAGEDEDDLRRFLLQLGGYIPLGITVEKIFLIAVGPPDSGKTTFAELIADVLGNSYAMKMSSEFFLSSMTDKFAYYAAQARGIRFLYSSETDEHRSLAQARIKEFTGGQDRVPARHPGGRPFHYAPTATAMLATNNLPKIRGGDQAIWERVRVLPFNNTKPKTQQDKFLLDKMREERAGILNRFIEGWQDWAEHGLILPRSVQLANKEYQQTNAVVATWFEDEVIEREGESISASHLYATYAAWCKLHKEEQLNQNRFGRELRKLGYSSSTDSTGRKRYEGITLRTTIVFN